MPRIPDKTLTSTEFRERLAQADEYSRANNLDLWAARIVWIGLIYNALGAKRFAERRSDYQGSQAWACYTRLVEAGVFIENSPREGIAGAQGVEPWESDPLRWFDDLCRIAAGEPVPANFPVLPGQKVQRKTR